MAFTSPGPTLWQYGPLALRWYGLLIGSAVLLGLNLSQFLAKKRQLDPNLIADLSLALVIFALVGARLYYVVFQWSYYRQNPLEIVALWHGGLAIHGAILAGLATTWFYARQQKVSLWQLTDLLAPSLALGQMIGRWGNFFNSEAFGVPTDLPWKLYIPYEHRPPELRQFEYFHPTFLYESLWNLLVLILLLNLFFRYPRLRPGTLTLVYFVAYSVGRLVIEGLRTDSLMLGWLRIAQVVSFAGIAVGGAGLLWLYYWRQNLPDVIPPESKYNKT
ncbi:Prolipoprotein diacylglyceryl transferase [Gloeomargarita lithophora Alchichica-D10]|uniref:Phosphatidylglycerol--prolipoprotein diacylglyceryl transferase n=1 Tax=Gloeomargarita lithophora Alchichica-D10 TaxID=1188229 RepID=A0A1J0AAS3_9CYAN|nr:prolipoprotein diacylglyceryl transferase [Gloeomargarita lithophora]APB33031.1 Prolipoprotein diacylglyceryl transferase [Gloeomargarita lithophora Alchichica-D10]